MKKTLIAFLLCLLFPVLASAQIIIIKKKTVIDDSYSEANVDTTYSATDTNYKRGGQSFTSGGGTLDSVVWYLKKGGTPTGNGYAEIYAHTGTYGTSSIPTGAVLATSDAFDISTLTTSYQLITFHFSGANRISLTNTTNYVAVFYNASGSADPNIVYVGGDGSVPSHSGNEIDSYPSWPTPYVVDDLAFYVNVVRE
jgi:galactokinase